MRQKPKKFKKVFVLNLVPILRVQKQLKKFFQKTVKMFLVPATKLKNKNKNLRLVAAIDANFPVNREKIQGINS